MATTINKIVMTSFLTLGISVLSAQTHWTMNVHDFQYDMTAYFTLQKNNEIVQNLEDYEVAAFVNGQCRGVATLETQTGSNNVSLTYGYLRVYSNNSQGETVAIKAYQKSTSKVWVAIEELTFKALGLQGLPSNPFIINIYDEVEDEEGNAYKYNSANSVELKMVAYNDAEHNGIVSIPAAIGDHGELSVTGIADDAFADVDKSKVEVIDLSATAVAGLTVSRLEGCFKGFDESTLIYLPEGTANQVTEGEKNVIVGDLCAKLYVSESKDFKVPKAFLAEHVTFERSFVTNKTATVYLPFSIPSEEAGKLGTFHTFKSISDEGTAVFNSAETDDIQANVPYIFVPKETMERIDVVDEAGIINVPVTSSTAGVNGSLIGTTTAIVWDADNAPENIYGFAAEDRGDVSVGTFVKAALGASIARYRAYLVISASEARSYYPVVIDNDQASGVVEIESQKHALEGEWFDMKGIKQRGVPMKKSVYIVNGQKVVIK